MGKFRYNKVTIAGMGFMGGSLGKQLISSRLAKNVTGLGRNLPRLRAAKRMKAATEITGDIAEAVSGADIVVLCVPVMLIPGMFASILPFLDKKTVVTDIGSVKESVEKEIKKIDRNKQFCGSHPMVGSEKTGIKNLKPGLYKGGACMVTGGKSKKTSRITGFWKALGMKVIKMTAARHDRAVSGISHFPHLLSFAMVNLNPDLIKNNPDLIGKGFKDATRIAASGEEIWSDIFIANKNRVINDIKQARSELLELKKIIAFNRVKSLKVYIKKARSLREGLSK